MADSKGIPKIVMDLILWRGEDSRDASNGFGDLPPVRRTPIEVAVFYLWLRFWTA
jgi:hypothetical protein